MTGTMPSMGQREVAEDAVVPEPVLLVLDVGQMVHGGYCVAHHLGRVVFVRHAIPGERVVAQVTDAGPSVRPWWADTVQVVRASEHRRAHPWKLADSLRAYRIGRRPVAGAEYGHIVMDHQRRLKAQVFRDTMTRIGRVRPDELDIHVLGRRDDEPAGLHWSTRHQFRVSPSGRLSLPVHRSPVTVPVRNAPPALPALGELPLWDLDFSGASGVEVALSGHTREAMVRVLATPQVAASMGALQSRLHGWRGQLSGLPDHVSAVVALPPRQPGGEAELIGLRGEDWLPERVSSGRYGTRAFRVSGDAFWHPHRDAPAVLVESVMAAADPRPGHVVADLYAGAGLFSAFLAEAVGPQGAVLAVEAAARASQDARQNLRDLPQVAVLHDTAERATAGWLHEPGLPPAAGGLGGRRLDAVVLGPPHAGAGPAVLGRVHRLGPGRIVYVSANPVSLAHDTRHLAELGWRLDAVEVHDLHPNTHRMVAVCRFTRR
ncbi:class I SAM-dependent RNA methyltransferase [Citricoccus sp. SGAir0253]|uniref:class I SAM-dependent RNA methyltransferase n=1 Tax=Citricoccus sp. SGAir0253 TaxID=2567881 RepID=UPI0010CD5232|nr:class I SAM-dependent RNA methyltransferase [Citricoccus sp. SGAir0253]QCU77041.1 class I SAM-dependent RNA methyltransferase [Citricoccus sp. SGAir0253]